jgi:hypothetical protein
VFLSSIGADLLDASLDECVLRDVVTCAAQRRRGAGYARQSA